MKRREFLKLLLATTGTVVGLELANKFAQAESPQDHEASEHKWAMVIDQAQCTGCGYCIEACRASNDINPTMSWNKLYSSGDIGDQTVYTPIACQHCAHAPCVSVCPVKASYYREDGIVMMDYDRCIGCRYCEVACPYGARSFNWDSFDGENPAAPEWGEPDVERRPRGVVEKCSFCYQRIDRGLAAGLMPGVDPAATPACVNACPNDARFFGDLNDPDSNVSKILEKHPHYQLLENLGTGPRVYYLPVHPSDTEDRS